MPSGVEHDDKDTDGVYRRASADVPPVQHSSGLRRTLNSFYVSGVKDQRGFAEPEQVEAGLASATPDGNKEQEHGPIVKTKIGTTHILRATIGTTRQRFLPG